MSKQYDVQILTADGWQWAGIEPKGLSMTAARNLRNKVAIHPYWREQIGVTKLRIRVVS